MLIREAAAEDLDVVTDLRLRFLAEHRGLEPSDLPVAFAVETRAFLDRHFRAGTSRSWIASAQRADVGVVTMLVLDLPPRPEGACGLEGYIVKMYVEPDHRRRGVASTLLERCRNAATGMGLRRLALHATDDGRPLYASAGFESNPNWMELRSP